MLLPKAFFCFTISTRAKAEQPSKKGKNSQEVACAPPTGDKESVLLFAWSFVLRTTPPPPPGLQRCLATKTRHGWCPISFNRSTATRALEGPATWQSHMRHIESGACCCSNSKGQQHFVCWAAERSHIGESDVNRKWWLSESNSEGCYLIKCTFFRNMLTFDCMILVFFKLSKDILCIIKF